MKKKSKKFSFDISVRAGRRGVSGAGSIKICHNGATFVNN